MNNALYNYRKQYQQHQQHTPYFRPRAKTISRLFATEIRYKTKTTAIKRLIITDTIAYNKNCNHDTRNPVKTNLYPTTTLVIKRTV